MASSIQVYEALKDLINKEQRGFITPSVFNSFAQIAQVNIFNSILEDQIKAKQLAKQGVDVDDSTSMKIRKKEDINSFLFYSYEPGYGQFNSVDIPKNSAKIVAIWDADEFDIPSGVFESVQSTQYEIFHDQSALRDVINSHLSAPTESYRLALIADKIYIYGSDDFRIYISYYNPVCSKDLVTGDRVENFSPSIGTFIQDGVELINIENTRDFVLPSHYTSEIIYEMARMIGIRLRDQDIIAYTQQKIFSES